MPRAASLDAAAPVHPIPPAERRLDTAISRLSLKRACEFELAAAYEPARRRRTAQSATPTKRTAAASAPPSSASLSARRMRRARA